MIRKPARSPEASQSAKSNHPLTEFLKQSQARIARRKCPDQQPCIRRTTAITHGPTCSRYLNATAYPEASQSAKGAIALKGYRPKSLDLGVYSQRNAFVCTADLKRPTNSRCRDEGAAIGVVVANSFPTPLALGRPMLASRRPSSEPGRTGKVPEGET